MYCQKFDSYIFEDWIFFDKFETKDSVFCKGANKRWPGEPIRLWISTAATPLVSRCKSNFPVKISDCLIKTTQVLNMYESSEYPSGNETMTRTFHFAKPFVTSKLRIDQLEGALAMLFKVQNLSSEIDKTNENIKKARQTGGQEKFWLHTKLCQRVPFFKIYAQT